MNDEKQELIYINCMKLLHIKDLALLLICMYAVVLAVYLYVVSLTLFILIFI